MPKPRTITQQRKRRIHMVKGAPFPVPIASITGEPVNTDHWFYYTGTLMANAVTVHHSGDMDFLYRLGFFGKGEMSRGQPQWAERSQVVSLPVGSTSKYCGWGSVFPARVMNRSRYMAHLKWNLLAIGNHAALKEIKEDEEKIIEEHKEGPEISFSMHPVAFDPSPERNTQAGLSQVIEREVTDKDHFLEVLVKREIVEETNKSLKSVSWDDGEGDGDFWTSDSTGFPPQTSVPLSGLDWKDTEPGDEDFWALDDPNKVSLTENLSTDVSKHVSKADFVLINDEYPRTLEDKGFNKNEIGDSDSVQVSCVDNSTKDSDCLQTAEMVVEKNICALHSSQHRQKMEAIEFVLHNSEKSDPDSVTFQDGQAVSCAFSHSDTQSIEVSHSHLDCRDTDCCRSPVTWSHYCEANEYSNDSDMLFVVPDSDEEETGCDGKVHRVKRHWKPVVKRDPFPLREALHLCLEEAFFLSFALGCLRVEDSDKKPLELTSMWTTFCHRQPRFLPNYIAYHYFRSKNWVPKPGLKFGCDFILYKEGPPFFHGSYSVVVKFTDSEGKPVDNYSDQRQFTWTTLAGLKRITEHVGKELMFCYVIKPKEITLPDMMSPKCISLFQVKEILVSRWVSAQEREDKGMEDMP